MNSLTKVSRVFYLLPVLIICCISPTLESCYSHFMVYGEPPPARVEVIESAPAPGYVWIEGRWVWGGGGWAWNRGRWEAPPRPNAAYVHGFWMHRNNGYYYQEGHWKDKGEHENRNEYTRRMGSQR